MRKTLILAVLLLGSCGPLLKWQIDYPDNRMEELIEKAIEKKFGKDIDLTPVTGEEKQSDSFYIEYEEEENKG